MIRHTVFLMIMSSVFLSFSTSYAQTNPWVPYLVKDLNRENMPDSVEQLTKVGNVIFFKSESTEYGSELWRSDGTEAGTYLVKDIAPGPSNSNIKEMINVNGTLFFVADDGSQLNGLWKSDGTEAGTVLVKYLDSNYLEGLIEVNGVLYFSYGIELWRSDGTESGTWPLCSEYYTPTPTCAGSFDSLANIDGTLFFRARSNVLFNALELWKSDGTIEGTVQVKDIYPGDCGSDFCSSAPEEITELNGVAYFVAKNDQYGFALWRSDGTEQGTYLVKDVDPINNDVNSYGTSITELTHVGEYIYFSVEGATLWRTDGTALGTIPLAAFGGHVRTLTNAAGKLWFVAHDDIHGIEPWVSDGTVAGTYLVKDINNTPEWNPEKTKSSYPDWFFSIDETVFFPAETVSPVGVRSWDLWASDGTEAGTIQLDPALDPATSNSFGTRDPTSIGTKLFFVNRSTGNSDSSRTGLWTYDIPTEYAKMVKDINTATGGISIGRSIALNNKMYFAGLEYGWSTGPYSFYFWQTDGTNEGTKLIESSVYNEAGILLKGGIDKFLKFKNQLLLVVELQDDQRNFQTFLFTYNEKTSQTELLMRIPDAYDLDEIVVINDLIYYKESFTEHAWGPDEPISGQGVSIMRSDGSEEGTISLYSRLTWWQDAPDSPKNYTSCYRENDYGVPQSHTDFTKLNNHVFFNFCDGVNGFELWRSDGTPEGTLMVKDIAPTGVDSYGRELVYSADPRDFMPINDTLYFSANTPEHGLEVWRSDGTANGTHLLKDIWPGTFFDPSCWCERPNSSIPWYLTEVNGELYFQADNGDDYYYLSRLWKSDGTEQGTINLKPPGSRLYNIRYLQEYNGDLIFNGSDVKRSYPESTLDSGLWKTTGADSSSLSLLSYNASNPRGISPYDDPFKPWKFLEVAGSLLFSATTDAEGSELWVTDGSVQGTRLLADINPGTNFSGIRHAHNLNGVVVFEADDGFHGSELYAMKTYWDIEIDIKPGSSDNCINFNEHGVIPVVIYGSLEVNVLDIDPDSLTMQGLAIKMAGKSGKYSVDYRDVNQDGYTDIFAHFEDSDGFVEPGTSIAEISGRLSYGITVKGNDDICIVP